MMRGIDSTYEELFAYACPKFITAAPPNLDAPGSNTNQVTRIHNSWGLACMRPTFHLGDSHKSCPVVEHVLRTTSS